MDLDHVKYDGKKVTGLQSVMGGHYDEMKKKYDIDVEYDGTDSDEETAKAFKQLRPNAKKPFKDVMKSGNTTRRLNSSKSSAQISLHSKATRHAYQFP